VQRNDTPPFSVSRELRFGDCDPSGIAYFPSYLNILNGVVEDFWTAVGFPWTELMTVRKIATPTVHIDCQFSRPSFFGDQLTFQLTVGRVGRTSLRFEHVISGADGIRWQASQTVVATSIATRHALPWPKDIRDALMLHMREPDGLAHEGGHRSSTGRL
jgi:4-hydroxybenzoyl-CoA thioesterase